jgi:serine/threonine protein kinase
LLKALLCRFFGGPFESRGFQWLVTEYVRGHNLCEYIRMTKRAFTRNELFTFFECMLGILEYVHCKRCVELPLSTWPPLADLLLLFSVYHRDIKPDNIMVDPLGFINRRQYVLIDFGSCRRVFRMHAWARVRCMH